MLQVIRSNVHDTCFEFLPTFAIKNCLPVSLQVELQRGDFPKQAYTLAK